MVLTQKYITNFTQESWSVKSHIIISLKKEEIIIILRKLAEINFSNNKF